MILWLSWSDALRKLASGQVFSQSCHGNDRQSLLYQLITKYYYNQYVNKIFFHATVAQLVEQLIRNQQVAGSSPASSSTFRTTVFISAVLLFKPAGYIRSPFLFTTTTLKKMFKFYEFMITMANVNILFIVVDNLRR